MAIIRWLLGRLILLFNFIFSPKAPKLSAAEQQVLADKTASLSLYQLAACPFCVKVRRAMKRNGMNIKLQDIKQPDHLQTLISEGGKRTVPCLRITESDNKVIWLYESSAIINYLNKLA